MKTDLFDYNLPKKLIAQTPANPRDSSKLLTINRDTGNISHHQFNEITKQLRAGDVLVFNQTKVFPARLIGKKETGGRSELLLLECLKDNMWKTIYKGKINVHSKLIFGPLHADVIKIEDNIAFVNFNYKEKEFWTTLDKTGITPLPPYITSNENDSIVKRKYQTVYAKNTGSAAAPTAGFHFSQKLLNNLKKIGIQTEFVTLHIGLDTFAPVKEKEIEKHKIHKEHFTVDSPIVQRLNKAKFEGRRIVSVGTTTTRVLETLAVVNKRLRYDNLEGSTELFIYPSYKFKFVDALITNFHLPKSTLLALVSAFVSYPNSSQVFSSFKDSLAGIAYIEAINNNYRFYSFGDACFIY